MSTQQKMHYKDSSPIETVKKLKQKLDEMGISIQEEWQPESVVGTYALRTTFNGTGVGTNGKGVSKEFSLASSYAEFFERFQNNMMSYAVDGYEVGMNFHIAFDEKELSSLEIVNSDNSFINFYLKSRGLETKTKDVQASEFKKLHRGEFIVAGKEDSYTCLPFYSINQKKTVYLPQSVYRVYYGSNGMCAGNTPEEAIVQGLSEIVERAIQKRLFLDKPVLPDIPDDYIQKFPYVFEMYQKLKKNTGFRYMLKDCSFGGKYPVAALVILEENTGSYGIKLGCHPDFGVAMERTFTEAAQGQDILKYSNRSKIDFQNKGVEEPLNIYNSYKVGLGQFPYQLFGKNPSWEFTPVKDVSNMSNHEILNEWLQEIKDEGYDVLIRDVSVLGFPSYHIIIPGFSEMNVISDKHFRAYNTRHLVSGLLLQPETINKKNAKYIRGVLDYYLNSLLENSIASYRQRVDNSAIPGDPYGCGSLYMISMCHALEENYLEAARTMNIVYTRATKYGVAKDEIMRICASYYYFSAMAELGNREAVMSYMHVLFDNVLCDYLDNTYGDPSKIFTKVYAIKEGNNKYSEGHYYYAECLKKLYQAEMASTICQDDIKNILD